MLETQPDMTAVTMKSPNARMIPPPVRLVACPRPFSIDRIEQYIPEGTTVAEMMRGLGINPDRIFARVFIDDQLVPKAEWEWAVPRAGQFVTVRAIPTDGGQGKDALRIVAMIAVVALAVASGQFYGAAFASSIGVSNAVGAAIITTTVSIAGTLAVNALIPPPKPKLQDLSSLNLSPTLSLTGTSNQLAPYAPIPRVYGRHRIFPPLAARPFTEIVGNDQYLRLLFCCGYGPLTLEDLKIGQTDIEQFSDVELEVRYGYADDQPITLFPDDVYEDPLSIELLDGAAFVQRTTQPNAKEISVEWTLPNGLATYFSDSRSDIPNSVTFYVDFRKVGDVSWTTLDLAEPAVAASVETNFAGANNDIHFEANVGGTGGNSYRLIMELDTSLSAVQVEWFGLTFRITYPTGATASQVISAVNNSTDGYPYNSVIASNKAGNNGTGAVADFNGQFTGGRNAYNPLGLTANTRQPFRHGIKFYPPDAGAQYQVRVKVTKSAPAPAFVHTDTVFWSMLRTVQTTPPVAKAGLCLVAMRIKATGQLNGTVEQFNCIAQSVLPDWNGAAWVTRPTSNPASIYRNILQGSANARPLADSRLDLTTLQAFHTRCVAKGFEFNGVIDYRTTVFELCRDVLAAARASFGLRDGKYSVVEELAQTTPVQHFTPRNSWGFRGTKVYVDLPHALKTRFVNPDRDWQQDEQFVYADGYSASNATKFETLDLIGVTVSEQAWKLGRYHLAVAQLRPEVYELHADVENLVCTRGDLVRVVHDVPLFGAGYGRIKALATDGGGNATGFTLDDTITMDGALSYAARFRKSDGTSLVQQVITAAGEQSVFTFTAAIPSATKPAVGDLVLMGVLNAESVEMIVKGIEPGPDLTAKLVLVDAAPAVLTADSGPIPAFDSQITLPVPVFSPLPIPIIDAVQSDETVLVRDVDGSYQSRILISFQFLSGFRLPVSKIEAQFRKSEANGPWSQIFAAVSGTAPQISILPVEDGTAYDVRLRSVNDDVGATSEWATVLNHTVIGKTTPPPDVTALTFDSDGIRWAYPTPPVDFDGFLVRIRPGTLPIWDDAFQLTYVPITDTSYPLIPDGSTRVVMVKAVDVAGNQSQTAAWLLQDESALVLRNLAETLDLKADGFPGTYTDCSLSGGNLVADSQTLYWSNDSALYWSNDSALYWTGSYKNMSYEFTVRPAAVWATGIMRLQVGITAQGWTLYYKPGATALFWSSDAAVFWSSDAALFWVGAAPDFVGWPGALEFPKRQDYTFLLSAVGGQIQGKVSVLNVLFDMPDLTESFNDVMIPVGGTRLSPTKQFHTIRSVSALPQDDGGTLATIKVADREVVPGPLLIGYDVAHVQTAGLAEGTIYGY